MNEVPNHTPEIIKHDYFHLSLLGKNEVWRYLLSFFIIIACWLGFSVILGLGLSAYVLFDNNPATGFDPNANQLMGVSNWITLAVSLISFIPLLLSLLFAVRVIHQRPLISLVTSDKRIDWKRVGIGFIAIGVLVGVCCLVEALLFPGRYQFTFDASEYIKFLPLIVIFIPIQAATEELVFRGYLIQSFSVRARHPWIPMLLSSVLFMSLHFANPEVEVDLVLTLAYYFMVGVFLALITLKDNRLELALGCHIGINMFVLIANYSDSVLPMPSIFTVTTLDPVYNLLSFSVMAAIFYSGLLFLKNRNIL